VHPSRVLSEEVLPVEYYTVGYESVTTTGAVDGLGAFTLLANPVIQKDMLAVDMALPFTLGREC